MTQPEKDENPCPSPATILGFALDALDAFTRHAVTEHTLVCPLCRAGVQTTSQAIGDAGREWMERRK